MLSDALEVPSPTLPYSGHEEEGERDTSLLEKPKETEAAGESPAHSRTSSHQPALALLRT